jgi:undecaprenyl-diphosphatase
MAWLKSIDIQTFQYINGILVHPWLDQVMIAVSDPWFLSVFTIIILWVLWKKNKKNIYPMLLLLLLSIGITDAFAYRFLKPYVQRYRPCYESTLVVRKVTSQCGGDYSFPSNHAANGMAAVSVIMLLWGRAFWPLSFLAILVGYSRVYLGVHYPFDVLGGFVLGVFTAFIVFRCYVFVCKKLRAD